MINLNHFIALDQVGLMIVFNSSYHSLSYRRCSGCQKKRSLRRDSFFAEFPKVALATLLRVIFYFVQDDSQKRISQTLNLTRKLVSQICRRQQDLCSRDLEERPFIPFGGPGAVVKCDESKFNHKAKVKCKFLSNFLFLLLLLLQVLCLPIQCEYLVVSLMRSPILIRITPSL